MVEPIGDAGRNKTPDREPRPIQRQGSGRRREWRGREETDEPVSHPDLGRDVCADREAQEEQRAGKPAESIAASTAAPDGLGVWLGERSASLGQRHDDHECADHEDCHTGPDQDGLPGQTAVHGGSDHQRSEECADAETQMEEVERLSAVGHVQIEEQTVRPAIKGTDPQAEWHAGGEEHRPLGGDVHER